MHIVFLTNEYPKKGYAHGGIGTFVKFLAHKLVLKNIKISILGINNLFIDEFEIDNKVEVYRIKKSRWKFAKFYDQNRRLQSKIEEINKKYKIDIIEGSELNFAFFKNNTPYKKVIRLHGGHHFFAHELNKKTSFWRAYQEKKSFKKADEFIAVSNYVAKKTKKYLKFNFNHKTIYNSINLENFYESNSRNEKNNKLVFIGTVCEKKGVEQLVKAFPMLKKHYPNLTLDIVGRDWKSKDIESYIEYLKNSFPKIINNDITFTGVLPQHEIPKIIEAAKVCIYPSLAESFGLTIIEAMAMGKCVAASNIEPFKEIVGKSESVLFFNPYSLESISETILEILNDINLQEKLKVSSRLHIFNKFETDKIIKENINFYESLK